MNETKYINNILAIDKKFEIEISKDLYWVPYCLLGRFTSINNRISLLDSLVYFIQNDFIEYDDTDKINYLGIDWELHRKSEVAYRDNSGCCSSVAAWVCYELTEKYEEIGMISIFRPNGTGHVINYIKENDFYYIFDFLPFTKKYQTPIKETGHKKDFIKSPHFTSCCMKTKDLNSFSYFFGRLQAVKGFDHLFFQIRDHSVPPCTSIGDDDFRLLLYPDNKKILKLNGYKEDNLFYTFIPFKVNKSSVNRDYYI